MIAILVDVTRCTGCNQCVDACTKANISSTHYTVPQSMPDGLSANQLTSIVMSPEGRFVRKFCRHCLEPACVSVCPVGAMYKTPQGAVVYDGKKCMGCRYCMMACPYGIPRYQWDSAVPLIQKCTFCYDRLKDGLLPACVEACPYDVLTFGERDQLLTLAHQRLQEFPDLYLPTVYGEHDAGGTSVLYISDTPLDFLRLNGYQRNPSEQALPELSWAWLNKVPSLSLATTGLMTGLFWIIGRRIQAEENRGTHSNRED